MRAKARKRHSPSGSQRCSAGVCEPQPSLSRPSGAPSAHQARPQHQGGLVPLSQSNQASWRNRNQQERKARAVGSPRQEVQESCLEEVYQVYQEGLRARLGAQGLRDGKNDVCGALAVRTFQQVWTRAIKSMRPGRGGLGSK